MVEKRNWCGELKTKSFQSGPGRNRTARVGARSARGPCPLWKGARRQPEFSTAARGGASPRPGNPVPFEAAHGRNGSSRQWTCGHEDSRRAPTREEGPAAKEKRSWSITVQLCNRSSSWVHPQQHYSGGGNHAAPRFVMARPARTGGVVRRGDSPRRSTRLLAGQPGPSQAKPVVVPPFDFPQEPAGKHQAPPRSWGVRLLHSISGRGDRPSLWVVPMMRLKGRRPGSEGEA